MPTYEQIMAFMVVMLAACSAIVLINNARKAIVEIRKPFDEQAEHIDAIDKCLARDKARLDRQDECNRLMLRCNMQMMTHMIDGNHVDKLAETRDEVQQYLIDR